MGHERVKLFQTRWRLWLRTLLAAALQTLRSVQEEGWRCSSRGAPLHYGACFRGPGVQAAARGLCRMLNLTRA